MRDEHMNSSRLRTSVASTRHWRAALLRVLGIVVAVSMLLGFSISSEVNQAKAADAKQFDAGYIISDSKFYNSNSMTATQIQTFLNEQVPTCHPSKDSNPSSIVCLKNYKTTTIAKKADAYCSGYTGGKTQTAAQIIDGVARSCGVSQQVLLVLLQKENGLVTHDWPSPWRYKTAMGFGCPDTAACDSQYYGFFNQVFNAARQYKLYKANPSSYQYRVGTNVIQWHPNVSCGTSTVKIRNQATAGLYNYTPYRPNQAALDAGYAEGNSCSSYGNRNFYLYYRDWFSNPATEIVTSTNLSTMTQITVPDGRYYINSGVNYRYSIDIPGGSTVSGVSTQLHAGNQSTAQQFDFKRQSDGSYEILNAKSGKALDVHGAQVTDGTTVDQYNRNSSKAQRWFIRQASGGAYYLQSALGNMALDLTGAVAANGTKISIHTPNGTGAQQWLLTSVTSIPLNVPTRISSAINSNYVVDIASGSTLNGAGVQLYTSNDSLAQRFILSVIANGVYEIRNAASGKLIEVAGGQVSNNAVLQQYQSNSTQAQRWFVRSAGNSTISFYNLASGKFIDVAAGTVSPKKRLSIYSGNASKAQQWSITAMPAKSESTQSSTPVISDGVYTIRSVNNDGARIDVTGGSLLNRAVIQLHSANSTKAQQWQVSNASNGYVTIRNVGSGKLLDVYGGQALRGTSIDQYTANGTKAQLWRPVKNSQGYMVLQSALDSNLVLDARGGGTTNGTPIVVYTSNGTKAQQWRLIKQ